MPPRLDFELLLSVAEHVKEPVDLLRGSDPSVTKAIKLEKLALVSLMKACKTTNHIIAPVLYKDCITDNFETLAAGLENNKNLDQTTRLHLHYRRHWGEPSYRELSDQGWNVLELKNSIYGLPTTLAFDGVFSECRSLAKEGRRLRRLLTEDITVLPKLKIVSMGGIGENLYNGQRSTSVEQHCDIELEECYKTLPLSLIDMPSVQHSCQAVSLGPLAVPSITYKPQSTLQTFTHHPRCTPIFGQAGYQPIPAPPIIIGAINRYYGEVPCYVPWPPSIDSHVQVRTLVVSIRYMLSRLEVSIADPVTGIPIPAGPDSNIDPSEDTTIEIYNCYRYVHRSNYNPQKASPIDPAEEYRDLLPDNLDFCQIVVDACLPRVWQGKVWVKNREEAPPCVACGFDIDECFKAAIKVMKELGL